MLWLQVVSDLAIAGAYFAIPLVLFDLILKRRDLLFRRVAGLFVLFIAACGATHLLSVWTIWVPMYRLEALAKAVTAAASVTTAVVLVRMRPLIFRLPSITELELEIEVRRRAEEDAREKEERFRNFVESVEDYAIYRIDPQGMVETWNHGAQRLYGYTEAEIAGKSLLLFYTPEDLDDGKPLAALRTAREMGRFQAEVWQMRKDGTRFLASVIVRPLLGDLGELRGFSKVTRDLTESRELEMRHQILLEAAPDAIVIVRQDGHVDFLNMRSETMFGYDRSEVVGKPVDMLVPPHAREAQAGYVEELFENTAAPLAEVAPEIFGMRKDGSSFPLEFTVNPLETRDGRLLVFSIRDLSERNRTQAQFRALLEAVPDAIVLMAAPDRITYVNRSAEELFGFSRMELLGRSSDLLVVPRFRDADGERRRRYLAEPSTMTRDMRWEQVCLRKDGVEFPAEASVNPIETGEGTILMASVRDLTERRKTEARFQALLEAVPDAIVVHRMPDEIAYVNSRSEALFGYRRDELLGRSSDVLIPERYREKRRADRQELFRTLFATGESRNGEYLCVARDGREFEVEASVSPLETPEGPVIMASIRDTTERRKTEARFRSLLDSAPDAMVISNKDGVIELTNRQAERLFGYARAEMVGQRVDMLIPQSLREDYALDERSFMDGDFERKMGLGLELQARRKDGSEFPVEISFSPLEGPNGISMTAAIRDIAERRKSEIRFRALLESAPDAMVIVDRNGLIVLANFQTQRIFGYTRMELVGQPVEILVPSELQGRHRERRTHFFETPRQREMGLGLDLMAVRKDGTQFPVEISLSPLEGMDGTSVTAAIRDISERKLAAQQLAEKMTELRQSNEALEQFAHIASHDLQEPLRMVASYTQLLSKRYKGRLDADADEFIHFAVDGTQRMKRLIEDLLLYSRAGRGAPAATKIGCEDAVREAIGNLGAAIADRGAQVTWDALPAVAAVELHLVQIFQNLIGNAIKYCGERTPHIHIAAKATETEWIFSVADNGIGIEPRYFDRIFVIFQRLHGRGEYEGTGIGLAICKRILQQQGGRIWVESEPGIGSTFYFSLPMR